MSHRRSPQVPAERRRRRSRLALLVNLLIAISLACSLPSLSRPVETPEQEQEQMEPAAEILSAPPEPLPPALVESDPLPGSEIALNRPITLVFNQAMDRRSVEGAISGQPTLSGRFNWQGENILTFTPDSPFLPGSEVVITIAESARSEMGMPLLNPMTLSYRAAGYLRLTQVLPSPGSEEVNPTSALVVSFNRPVFPIGEQAPGAAQFTQPVITIDPPVGGRGQWINTSTYVFYPEPALSGGVEYTVQLNPDLKSLDGSPLAVETGSESYRWSFTTSLPELISIQTGQEPWQTGSEAVLDPEIILIFNQPMDPQSVADHFELLDSSLEPVPVVLKASDDPNHLVFQPENLLERRSSYTVVLRAGAQDLGGTPFESEASTILSTVPPLGVDFTNPIEGGTKQTYESIVLHFSAHLGDVSLGRYISFQPDVPNLNTYLDEDRRTAYISGEFAPETNYTLTIRQDLPDAWGGSLREPYSLNFRTLPLEPTLTVGYGVDILFLSPQGATLPAQATNLGNVAFTIGSLPLGDFLHMMGPEGFDLRQTYQPLGARFVQQALALPNNQSQVIEIALSPDGRPLSPGLYYLRFSAAGFYPPPPLLLISSNVQLTLKYSATEVLVWAVDLRANRPVADSQVSVYDETGQIVAEGRTDESGVFRSDIAPPQNPYISLFAVLGQPGEDQFGMVLSNWNHGLVDFSLGISFDYLPPRQWSYIYTDRPVYRPGQVVYFKALTRQAYNGRFSLPEEDSLELYLYDPFGEIVRAFSLPVSEFGGVEGEYTLPVDAVPGPYRLASRSMEYVEDSVSFQVAEYRKPEIDLQVSFASQEVEAGQELLAEVTANYFFGAPASNVPVRWSLYAVREEISLFDYTVGVVDTIWLESPYSFRPGDSLGELVAQGQAATGPDGSLDLNLPTSAAGPDGPLGLRRYTLEVVVVDESEAPVYNRASILVHPARFYVGLRPDSWAARAGRELGFDLQIVDWEGQPAGEHSLNVNFRKVTWEQQEPLESDPFYLPRYRPVYESVGSVSLMTGSDGLARLALTPPEPGTYLLDISGPDVAHTSTLIWAGGPGQAIWPNLPNQRLQLIPDYDSYYPGETAQVFVPNPYGEEALALVSLERGTLLRYEVISVEPEGATLSLELGDDEAPNIYLSLTLLGTEGEKPSFRYGVVELVVEPVVQTLNVEVLGLPESPLEPGEDLTMGLRVTGASGEPVRGEFSLAVVDKAVLALAEPNSPPVLEAFYGQQPLGVRTSLSLAGDAGRLLSMPGGMGGGGGEELAFFNIREEFPDTAYWNPSIATDSSGEAWVNFSLPDSLTSWQIDVRGITADSRVGQARQSLIASKELIIRPVTPRFFVAGDRLQLAAVVHNNTAQEIEAEVSLQAVGFSLDDRFPATQLVSIPSGGRARIEWWGTVQNIDRVDLIFSASGGGLFDSARPPLGRVLLPTGERLAGGGLPVLRLTARQTFATSGVMDSAGERLELVSIPESAVRVGSPAGELKIELSPSLASAVLESLDVIDRVLYETNEQIASRLLLNLETRHALLAFAVEAPEVETRLERLISEDLSRLASRQNQDGGWSWWPIPLLNESSDLYLSAYILFALSQAQNLGIAVDGMTLERAIRFLYAGMPSPEMTPELWQLDRLAFQHFALAHAGAGDIGGLNNLYELRSQLSPWTQALLALAFESLPGEGRSSDQTRVLLSDLQAAAVRSAGSAHWAERAASRQNLTSPVFNTAVVVYVLAQRDPAAPVLAEAVRYLMAHRQAAGIWSGPYETAWTLLAVVEYMKGTGDWSGSFDFSAFLNDEQIARGRAGAGDPVSAAATVPASNLYQDYPNALVIQRGSGPGRLYYTAYLDVSVPVDDAQPLNQGLSITRSYYRAGDLAQPARDLEPVEGAAVGEVVAAHLTLVVPEDAYYVLLEDFIPAGTEIMDAVLKTSRQAEPSQAVFLAQDARFDQGWGWWYFGAPQIYDERILWAADYLPAGTYELVYLLTALQPGEFRTLPARAWQFYFPDIQGSSSGSVFTVAPRE